MSSSNVTISSNIQNEINTINSFIVLYARWAYPIIVVFGVVCNLLNIYVFTKPNLRRNPCCMYFLSSSIVAFIYLVINLPLRTLQVGYNIDPTAYISIFCKLKNFFTYTWRALIVWYLVLASIDRFLRSSSNINCQRWSNSKVAFRLIPLTFILVHLTYSHIPIFYEILLPRRTCSIANTTYSIFLGIWHLISYGTGPPLFMLIFSLLTIRNVRHRQIIPVTVHSNPENRNSNKDAHLIRMALWQSLIVGLTTTTYAVSQWYTTLTSNQVKSDLQIANDNLFFHLTGSISAAGHCATFLIFTVTSQMYRQELCRRH